MFLSPLIIGHEGAAWWSGVCCAPIAGAADPRVKPPANAAPLLRSALRFSGLEPMRVSFADEGNEKNPAAESIRLSPRRLRTERQPTCPYSSIRTRSDALRSGRESDATQERGKAWIRAQRIDHRINLQPDEPP